MHRLNRIGDRLSILTEDQEKRVLKMHSQGVTLVDIAKVFSTSKESIRRVVTSNHSDSKPTGRTPGFKGGGRKRKFTEEQRLAIKERYETGNETMKQIAESLGVSTPLIQQAITPRAKRSSI